jgi:hypothetical protein
MGMFGIHGRSARSLRPKLSSACLPVVQALWSSGNDASCVIPLDPITTPAVVEPLEPKVHLTSFTAGISASTTFNLNTSIR